MLKRLRHHLSPPMVVSMIALFAALGGGYATAFSGSGTLQKAAPELEVDAAFKSVRSLNGFGVLQMRCEDDTVPDELQTRLNFSTDDTPHTVHMRWFDQESGEYDNDVVIEGGISKDFILNAVEDTALFHFYRTTPEGTKAQVSGTISLLKADGACPEVRIMALNTVE